MLENNIKQIIDILKKIEKKDRQSVNIYFNLNAHDKNKFMIPSYSDEIVKKIISKIKKTIKGETNITIIEKFFRDLVRIEVLNESNKNTDVSYCHKYLTRFDFDNGILIITNTDKIDENMFPKLSKYDNETVKKIKIYELSTINIIIEEDDSKFKIYFNIKSIELNKEEIKLLKDELLLINI